MVYVWTPWCWLNVSKSSVNIWSMSPSFFLKHEPKYVICLKLTQDTGEALAKILVILRSSLVLLSSAHTLLWTPKMTILEEYLKVQYVNYMQIVISYCNVYLKAAKVLDSLCKFDQKTICFIKECNFKRSNPRDMSSVSSVVATVQSCTCTLFSSVKVLHFIMYMYPHCMTSVYNCCTFKLEKSLYQVVIAFPPKTYLGKANSSILSYFVTKQLNELFQQSDMLLTYLVCCIIQSQ